MKYAGCTLVKIFEVITGDVRSMITNVQSKYDHRNISGN